MNRTLLNVICAAIAAALVACGGGSGETPSQLAMVEPSPAGPAAAMGASLPVAAPSAPEPRTQPDPLLLNRLGEELEQIESTLSRVADQQEALEVIREVRLELQKDAPNRLKVRGLVGALAQVLPRIEGLTRSAELLRKIAFLV